MYEAALLFQTHREGGNPGGNKQCVRISLVMKTNLTSGSPACFRKIPMKLFVRIMNAIYFHPPKQRMAANNFSKVEVIVSHI